MSLALDGATIRAGRAELIRDVSLAVEPGRLLALLGPNGAGKSTALSALAGDLKPAAGAASLDGRALSSYTPIELARRRAVLSQSQPFEFPMLAYEVVSLGRLPCEAPRDDAIAVGQSLSATGAAHLAARDYSTLSGGERQRVQIARALAQIWDRRRSGAPRYLLLDEPTASLDLKHQILTLEICQALAQDGVGVLCILHDVRLAREFADDAAILAGGRVFAQGPAAATLRADAVAEAFGIAPARAAALCAAAG